MCMYTCTVATGSEHQSSWKALDNIDLNLVSHRYVSGVLKDDHFVSARALASDRSRRGLLHGGPQLSHQNQMLTSNSNRSHQIQIAHSKFKSLTANYKSLTANYKSLTANSNRPQQIQIAHSKFKSPTANSNRSQQIKVAHSKFKLLTANYIPLGVFGYLQPAVQLV